MIRTSALSIASLLSTVAFTADGLGHGNQAAEEATIAQITHLPIEEVHQRLASIAETFGVPLQEVTDTFFDDAKAGLLPTAEEEAAAEEEMDVLIEALGLDDE